MAAPTLANVTANLGANGGPGSGGDFRIETFEAVPASATDAELTLSGVTLSHVLGLFWVAADTTDTTAANSEHLWIDEATDATKNCVVVSGGSLAVKRAATDTGGALVSKTYLITLIGY